MKKIIALSVLSFVLLSAFTVPATALKTSRTAVTGGDSLIYLGDKISKAGAVSAMRLPVMMQGKDSLKVKIMGKIESVCQKKGCWLKMSTGNNQEMMVRFKDYAFFAPKDASGKMIYMEGVAYSETISVEQLKHYAKDAGKSQKEIDAITKPESSLSFLASGVIIQK